MKAFLDTESSGTRAQEIAQLSYIITDDDLNIIKSRNYYFAVGSMSPFATKVHGLTIKSLRELSGGLRFSDRATEILSDLADCQLVCHNYRADFDILRREFERAGLNYAPPGVFCTMAHFRAVCVIADQNGANKNPSLRELIDYYAVDDEEITDITTRAFATEGLPPHDGRYDAAALYAVCKTALDSEDYGIDAREPVELRLKKRTPLTVVTGQSPVPAQVVSLATERRKKNRLVRLQQRQLAALRGEGSLKRYAWPLLALLVLVSLLLRVM
ncbi:MAG TPA: 3'-5' exonuclease [Bacillota bacterium]|nr:3'-5' exonuclease [Bacillota bacterium]